MTLGSPRRTIGMGGHHSAAMGKDEWLTPPALLAQLGAFDLDPCAPVRRPWPMAAAHYTVVDNGLIKPWFGRVWCNPPYGPPATIRPWLTRMVAHGRGLLLIFARTETELFFETVWERAAAVLFLRGRLHFHHVDGRRAAANAGAPSCLVAYGGDDAECLACCGLAGRFVPLVVPRAVVVAALAAASWRALVAAFLARQRGPVALDALYRALAGHPKARLNRHWRAKLRQTLQRGEGAAFRRHGRGLWSAAGGPA